ncbi:hypothetical protein [Streptomyces griseoaurantiacus]|uniref:hypothetical protein n=1 Tax=Streptomyces griseoaurantiacus TaxID=68213 RepID=UPI0036CE61AA
MLKFATAQIIAASLGEQHERFTKASHRAVFQYEARPGYLYVRSRAISSRCNDNFDEFPAQEIEASYRTFVGKPVFVNHVNDNHRRARGVIIDAALHQDRNPDGTPDTWAEVLMEIDAVRFPKLAKAILDRSVERTSMGCDVERSVCSACGNEARTPAEYCAHVPSLKGKRIYRATASGKKVGELVRETCYGLAFFENSILVEPPADPTAHFLGVDASGLGKAASKTASIDFSGFDHDGLEEDDDEDTPPTPAPTVSQPAPPKAAPLVQTDGAPADRQRRQDAVTQTRPFTPLKPSLNTLQAAKSPTREAASVIDATFIDHNGTIRAVAFGEMKAPADVDTLREPNCPVCGDMDTFDGTQCQICGFINPPEQFRDPDLDAAKRQDLRKQVVDPTLIDDNGELQRVNDDGTGMPQGDGQELVDPDQLDENGLPQSPFGDQALDGTQQDGPAVSDRNGDGIIQPDEIDPEGNVNVQQDGVDPGMGGQAAPRELPGWARDRTGDPFTPGPDMPMRPDEPDGPGAMLEENDNLNGWGMPMPVSIGDDLAQGAQGVEAPQGMDLAHPSDFVGDETDKPHWSWNRDVSDSAQAPTGPQMPQLPMGEDEEQEDPRRRRMSVRRTAASEQPGDGAPDLSCPNCGFSADATPPRSQDMANPQSATDGIVAGDVCPKCRKAQLLTPSEQEGASSVPPPAVPQFPRT